jgi:hypothetical protein
VKVKQCTSSLKEGRGSRATPSLANETMVIKGLYLIHIKNNHSRL